MSSPRARLQQILSATSFVTAAVIVLSSPASVYAQTIAPVVRPQVRLNDSFVRLLSPGHARHHPLADSSGMLPLVLELAPGQDARAEGFAPYGPGLATVRVLPSELERFETGHPGVRYSIWPPLHTLLDQSAQLNGTTVYRSALRASGSSIAGTGQGVVVGVIDTGIDASHADFLDATGHTRVAWLIDLTHAPLGRHPELETEFGCNDPNQSACAVLDKSDIDEAIDGGTATYVPRDVVGHGTHVASIAAGNGGMGTPFVGGAPEATLVIAGVAKGMTGEVSDPDIANGARFIFDRAAALARPVVVNLSLGGDFGPHDGSTPLELTLGSMVGPDKPGRAFVVAAGNSGSLYRGDVPNQILGIHTQLRTTLGVPSRAPILSPGRLGTPAAAGSVYIWVTYGATDRVAVGLSGPNGLALAPTAPGTKTSYTSPDGNLTVAVYNGVRDDPSLPLSGDAHGAIIIWSGSWPAGSEFALELAGDGFADAWVGSSLDGGQTQLFEHALLQGTVNVPATHPSLLAVGCTVNRTSWTDADGHQHGSDALLGDLSGTDSSCVFSAAGPTAAGAMKPELSAPGALVAAAMSRDAVPVSGKSGIFDAPLGACPDGNACLVVDPTHALLSGSSMSSPQVAGAIALLFERDPSLTQPEVTSLLQQGARRPVGAVYADYQLGPGALHIPGAMAALGARDIGIDRVPDPAQSWLSLSDGFAHPDLGPSISGTVQLRASDASIADGFDPARLTVEVSDAGVIKSPLARMAAGLYRFELAAQPGTGQDVMTVNVRFDGVPLGVEGTQLSGTRHLPIGADRWVAIEGATAYGGCSVASGRRAGGERILASGVLAALALLCQRRRRDRDSFRPSV